MKSRVAAFIEQYDRQGWHRTGTQVDAQAIEWLSGHVRDVGLEPLEVAYELDRVDVVSAYLEVDGERIQGVPLYDCTYTNPDGVTGTLGLNDPDADIMLLNSESWVPDLLSARKRKHSGAIVALTNGYERGLSLANAFDFQSPFGPPVLQIGNDHKVRLLSLAETKSPIRVLAQVERVRSRTATVAAKMAGRNPSRPPIVINTPLSGWWCIAAERGGGLACWIEVMRDVVTRQPDCDVWFAANTGHELGFMGLENFLDQYPDLAQSATWVHFGANIGASTGSRGQILASNQDLAEKVSRAIDRHVDRPTGIRVSDDVLPLRSGGEMGSVARRGGRMYLALTNDNRLFHMAEDRFDSNIDIDVVTSYANAFRELTVRLVGGDGPSNQS